MSIGGNVGRMVAAAAMSAGLAVSSAAAPLSPAGRMLSAKVRGYFRGAERLSPSQWAEKHIELPPGKQETRSGRVSFRDRPYQREPLDAFADPTVSDIVFVGPTRIGKTFFLRMALAWSIAGEPAATLWVDASIDKARDVSKKELRPMIDYNACLRTRKPLNRHHTTDLSILFPGAAFTMVGGNSPAGVAGDTVKRVFGNELDKWSDATEKEASIAELVRHRTESFDDERKHGWSSTPTIEEGQTWQYYLRGDQRKWYCICPRCEEPQELVWDNVRWDPAAKFPNGKWDLVKVKATARYSCARITCTAHDAGGTAYTGNGWTDTERMAAIQHPRSDWRATAIGEPGWRSYHLNGLYGPLKSNSCGALAVDFLSARNTGFYTARQDFWNSRMGMPWRDNVSEVTAAKFAKHESPPAPLGPYLRGELPAGFRPTWLVVGFDVQTNRLPYVVRAGDWTGLSFTVDHGDAPTWADLEKIQSAYHKRFPTAACYCIGDINFEDRRAETLEQIYRRAHLGWYGAEAFEKSAELVRLEAANVFLGGRLQKEGHKIQKLCISAYEFKVDLEKRLAGELGNWFTYQLPLAATELEAEEQREYYKQLLDEKRRPRKHRIAGKPPFEFYSRTGNNHAFDCEVYILALVWVLRKRIEYAARQPEGGRKVVSVST